MAKAIGAFEAGGVSRRNIRNESSKFYDVYSYVADGAHGADLTDHVFANVRHKGKGVIYKCRAKLVNCGTAGSLAFTFSYIPVGSTTATDLNSSALSIAHDDSDNTWYEATLDSHPILAEGTTLCFSTVETAMTAQDGWALEFIIVPNF